MHKVRSLAAVLVPLMFGCAGERPANTQQPIVATETADVARDTYALGTSLTRSGAVPRDAQGDQFTSGTEVFLSVRVAGASTDQEIEVAWVDSHGNVLRRDVAESPKGSQYAAFSSGATSGWPPGRHRAVVNINGRKVGEREFNIMVPQATRLEPTPHR